jgi:GTP pyrophosphokinase
MKIVKTGEARNKIRQYFKKEQRPENISVGKIEIDREFKRIGKACTEAQRNEILLNVARRIGIQDLEDLYNTIGYGGITVSKIGSKIKDEFDRVVKVEEPLIADVSEVQTVKRKKNSGGVIVDGVDGLSVKFSKCCNPLPGDSIIGFITKGYGISIHKQDCPNVISGLKNPAYINRWVNARWESSTVQGGEFEAQIRITAQPHIRLIADVTMALADMRVALLGISTHNRSDCTIIELTVSCKNLDHFKSILSRLRSVQNVEDVSRGYTT